MNSLRSRAVVYGLIIVLGLLSALPNVLPDSLHDKLPGWYSHSTVSLGLDLQGGSHLLLEADVRELVGNEQRAIAEQLSTELRAADIRAGGLQVDADEVRLRIQDAAMLSRALALANSLAYDTSDGSRRFDVDSANGVLSIRLTDAWRNSLTRDAVERSLQVVRQRLDESGLVEPSITRQGSTGILVQMPGVADPSEIRRLLGTTAKMSFHWVANSSSAGGSMTLPDADGVNDYRLERAVALEGEHIRDARMGFHSETREPVVYFKLDGEGKGLFAELTRNNIGRPLAVVLDGKVITAPVIRDVIAGGSGEISGQFTSTEASNLALLLRAGALPTPLTVIEERTVGPDLGSDAIAMGLSTGLLGAALVVAFMLGLYGRWGLIACFGLVVNVGLLFGVLTLLGATLTLPGIAGIILTIGMAVDA
ncbi:MAG: protein translocase subunit SecD, partial [Woeseia sp.]